MFSIMRLREFPRTLKIQIKYALRAFVSLAVISHFRYEDLLKADPRHNFPGVKSISFKEMSLKI